MLIRKRSFQSSTAAVVILLGLFLCTQILAGQTSGDAHAQTKDEPAQDSEKTPAKPDAPAPLKSESTIPPQEAQQLFHDVDEIIAFASKDTDLPIKHEVKRRLTSRDEVEAYLEKNMREDKDAQRLQRSELVLKKFGLVPRDFNLGKFLVTLLREQVAGYYDPQTKTVNLLDWLGADQQRPVLAHELTHALQDQSFNLKRWMKEGDTDLDKKKDPTPQDVANDEISEARQAVVEGQAMAVLIDYILAPLKKSLLNSPEVVQTLKQQMLNGTSDSPEFKNAPIFLKDELTFAYGYGLDFVAEILRKQDKDKAFAGLLRNPPRTTRQIMEPRTYLSGEQIPPMNLPNFKQVFGGYDRFDIGAMGEFDVSILVEQYAGREASQSLSSDWRGGYYYAARPKGNPSAPLGLLYVSRWSSPASASKFAAIYAESLSKRYQHASEITEAGKPLATPEYAQGLTGGHTWSTEEGLVEIEVKGNDVLVTESLDASVTKSLEQQVFAPAN